MAFDEMELKQFSHVYDVDILIITATDIELNCSVSLLTPIDEYENVKKVYLDNTTIYFGLFGKYATAIVKTNSMGALQRGGSTQTCAEAIDALKPKALFMVGIAFGKDKDKQSIGDILVSKSLCIYDPSRINSDGEVEYRGAIPESNLLLFNRCTQKAEHHYQYDENSKSVRVISGPILSGEKLVDNEEYKNDLFRQYPNAIGGEMEGAGIYSACEITNTPWILIKSICDWADGNKNKSYQKECAYIANTFLRSVLTSGTSLRNLSISPFEQKIHDEPEINIDAVDILKMLIPRRYWSQISTSLIEVKDSNKKIYYQYYSYDNRGRSEGHLFIGKNITLKNTFDDFYKKYSPPETMSIYLTKVVKNGALVNRIKGIKEKAEEYGISRSNSWEVNYVDDVVWDCTLKTDDDFVHAKRTDYIDQNLYPSSNKNSRVIDKSINFFSKKLINHQETSNSIIFGSGGVGKTTFCDALRNKFDLNLSDLKKKILIVKGERISQIRGAKESYVESLMDLYNLFESEFTDVGLDQDEFKINYMCGNIVVVIDGLDEIDSALGERFNLEKFFDSLESLDDRFHNTKIIITTRDYFEEILVEKAISFKSYRLNGFTEKDLDDYLNIRLVDKKLVADAKKFLDDKKLTVNQYFVPMLVDWVCEITVRKLEGKNERPFQVDSRYFLKGYIFDEILVDLITREIDKQSIGCGIDDLFELLAEIVLDHNGFITKVDLEEYVKVTFDEDVDKFLKSPIFSVSNCDSRIALKYDALSSIVKSRYLRNHLNERRDLTEKTIKLMKETFDGKSSLLNDLVDSLSWDEEETIETVKHYINQLIYKLSSCQLDSHKRNIYKCLSGFTYIAFMKSIRTTKLERSGLIKELFSIGGMIQNFRIFGEFYPIDLSDMKFMDSGFYSYEKLDECKYPENNSAIFTYCTFDNTNIEKKCGAKKSHFEKSCTYVNCNVESAIESFEKEKDSYIEQIKNNIISISRYIDNTGKSINLIKMNTNINWISGHRGFVKELERYGYIKPDKKGHYYITSRYLDSVSDVKNGTIPTVIEDLIFDISGQ